MATPLSGDRLLAALRAEGCRVVEYKSWRTHNRNHKGAWGPVNGVVIHHTVSSGEASSVELCYAGHSALPGPLCHTVGGKSGALYMVGHGRANHAGSGDGDVLAAVINETPLPVDNEADTDGNARFYGIEIVNLGNGSDQYPAVQYDAAVRWAAAICRAHGWGAESVIGHKEWQPGKVDPLGPVEGRGDFSMTRFRADVAERLSHAASWSPGQTPTTPTEPEQEADMPLTKDDVTKVWMTDGIVKAPVEGASNAYWAPASFLRDNNLRLRAVQSTLAAQQATIAELTATVAKLASNAAELDADALVARVKGEIEKVTVRLDVDGS